MVNYHQKRVRVNYHYLVVMGNGSFPSMVQGIKSHRNRGVIRTNQKGNYGVFLGYLDTLFHTNRLGNILSFSEVDIFLLSHTIIKIICL